MSHKKLKIVMVGAGSGFVVSIANELASYDSLKNCEFVLLDVLPDRLKAGETAVRNALAERGGNNVKVIVAESQAAAFEGADYVITSCEVDRWNIWLQDLRIPERYGVYQPQGENGGPGGIMHAIRNISMFMGILADMERICPNAWLMNFTNPMSFLCTYFKNYSPIKALGFCHQVHGSMGVVAEMLGEKDPGAFRVLSAGVNHLNWLFDIRRKDTGEGCLDEFLAKVRESVYWKRIIENVPEQVFTLEVLNTFNMYPIGYDRHIAEYLPFFWERHEWDAYGFEPKTVIMEKRILESTHILEAKRLFHTEGKAPFPADFDHPYYAEKPCEVIDALETGELLYLDAINIPNHGAVDNLPSDAIVDVPAVALNGEVRSVHVGGLPWGPMEICRRQITLHEMIAQAAHDGDDNLVVQAFCLSPFVRSITQAKSMWADFRKEFRESLPTFK